MPVDEFLAVEALVGEFCGRCAGQRVLWSLCRRHQKHPEDVRRIAHHEPVFVGTVESKPQRTEGGTRR